MPPFHTESTSMGPCMASDTRPPPNTPLANPLSKQADRVANARRQTLRPSLTPDWDHASSTQQQDENAMEALSDPSSISKIVLTISEGFQSGDNLLLAPEPADLTIRRLRLESARPVLILEKAKATEAYRHALTAVKFSCRHAGTSRRIFSMTIAYLDGSRETVIIGQYQSDIALTPSSADDEKNTWLYDDRDFDMFLFEIQETGNARADFLPEAVTEKAESNSENWSVVIETIGDLNEPVDQPIGLLDGSRGDRIDNTVQKRLKDIDW